MVFCWYTIYNTCVCCVCLRFPMWSLCNSAVHIPQTLDCLFVVTFFCVLFISRDKTLREVRPIHALLFRFVIRGSQSTFVLRVLSHALCGYTTSYLGLFLPTRNRAHCVFHSVKCNAKTRFEMHMERIYKMFGSQV